MDVKRAYTGTRRQAATRATRRDVVEAARRLFLDQGYPATTMAEIAEESGTPQATVYRLFGSKRGILKEVLDVTLGGDDEQVEYQHRPDVRAALAAEDPGSMLDAFAHLLRGVMHRAGALQHVLATSALVDHDAAEMLEITRRQRHTGQSRIVRALARRKALRAGLTQPRAADIVYTVMSPEVFRILTVERGWSEEEYEAWLAHTLRTQLLQPVSA
jgi:AcrR family transcriptional regulator